MKRKNSYGDSLVKLKRAGSSLFSIATIVEEDGDVEDDDSNAVYGNETACVSLRESTTTKFKCKDTYGGEGGTGQVIMKDTDVDEDVQGDVPDATSSSSSGSVGGFYIDDYDDQETSILEKNEKTIVIGEDADVTASVEKENDETSATEIVSKTSIDKGDKLNGTDHKTGLVFEINEEHYDVFNSFHKERPLRIKAVSNHLSEGKVSLSDRCVVLKRSDSVAAERDFLDDEDFLRVHLPGYMTRLQSLSNCTCQSKLDREAEQFNSVYFTKDSVQAAKTAASSLCTLIGQVVNGDLDNGFAVIRPPGHHAEPGVAGGYCVINNVAVGVSYARERLGVKKVLIVDWDVHHGNGTQEIFLNDPEVLYFSVHRYHGGNFFPFLKNGGPNTVGVDEGVGFNVNVGWNQKGMGDQEYEAVWDKIVLPIADEFGPDLVVVSAGFDAAAGDMGECQVTPECFGYLTRRLMTLASGKVVCALEGGYVRSVLSRCVECVVRALLERKSEFDHSNQDNGNALNLNGSAAKSIQTTIACHKMYWNCLQDDEGRTQFTVEEKKNDL